MSPFLKHVFEEIPLFLIFTLRSVNKLFVVMCLEDLAHAQTMPTETTKCRGAFKMTAGPGQPVLGSPLTLHGTTW